MKYILCCTFLFSFVYVIIATEPAKTQHNHGHGHGHGTAATVAPVTNAPASTCPAPTQAQLRCLREWACQYIIRLDLRCLLALNGNPLLGGVLGNMNNGSNGLLANLVG